MTKPNKQDKFAKSRTGRKLSRLFESWDEKPPNNGDEWRIASFACDARTEETLTGFSATLVAFAALGAAALTLMGPQLVQAAMITGIAAVALTVGLWRCWTAGVKAGAQAVSDHREAVKLATLPAPAPAADALPEPAPAVAANALPEPEPEPEPEPAADALPEPEPEPAVAANAQNPQRSTRAAVMLGTAAAFSGGVLLTMAAHRRRR